MMDRGRDVARQEEEVEVTSGPSVIQLIRNIFKVVAAILENIAKAFTQITPNVVKFVMKSFRPQEVVYLREEEDQEISEENDYETR
ncbi:unnamed protein product [Diamesa serratosioi]